MKLTLTLDEFVKAWPHLQLLAAMKLKIQPAWWVARIVRKLEPDYLAFDERRVALLVAHGSKQKEPGSPVYDVPPDQEAAVDAEFRELLAASFDVDLEQKPFEFLGDISVEPAILARLWFLFSDGEPEPASKPP